MKCPTVNTADEVTPAEEYFKEWPDMPPNAVTTEHREQTQLHALISQQDCIHQAPPLCSGLLQKQEVTYHHFSRQGRWYSKLQPTWKQVGSEKWRFQWKSRDRGGQQENACQKYSRSKRQHHKGGWGHTCQEHKGRENRSVSWLFLG